MGLIYRGNSLETVDENGCIKPKPDDAPPSVQRYYGGEGPTVDRYCALVHEAFRDQIPIVWGRGPRLSDWCLRRESTKWALCFREHVITRYLQIPEHLTDESRSIIHSRLKQLNLIPSKSEPRNDASESLRYIFSRMGGYCPAGHEYTLQEEEYGWHRFRIDGHAVRTFKSPPSPTNPLSVSVVNDMCKTIRCILHRLSKESSLPADPEAAARASSTRDRERKASVTYLKQQLEESFPGLEFFVAPDKEGCSVGLFLKGSDHPEVLFVYWHDIDQGIMGLWPQLKAYFELCLSKANPESLAIWPGLKMNLQESMPEVEWRAFEGEGALKGVLSVVADGSILCTMASHTKGKLGQAIYEAKRCILRLIQAKGPASKLDWAVAKPHKPAVTVGIENPWDP